MECSQPPALTDDQLSAALDNEAEPAVTAHLAACPACAARLLAARALEQQLKAELYRHDCPSAHELADYQAGALAGAAAGAIAAHIGSCPLCGAELEALELLLADDPPRAQAAQRGPRAWVPRFKPILASIAPSPQATVLRGQAVGTIMAEAGETAIFLQLASGTEGRVVLTGQLLAAHPERWRAALVEVRQDGSLSCVAPLDPSGAFQCLLPTSDPAEILFIAEAEPTIVIPAVALLREQDE